MTALSLKRASASRRSGQWQHEDFDVLADGKVVGRTLKSGSRLDPRGDVGPCHRAAFPESEARLSMGRLGYLLDPLDA